jgi:hypothetical protein
MEALECRRASVAAAAIARCSFRRSALAAIALALASGCATQQTIPLACAPKSVTIFVDGERLDEVPSELRLRSDRAHTLFFSGGGFEKRSLILESRETEDGARLEPADPCRELRFEPVGKDVEFRVQE